jgi:hypothetical protein
VQIVRQLAKIENPESPEDQSRPSDKGKDTSRLCEIHRKRTGGYPPANGAFAKWETTMRGLSCFAPIGISPMFFQLFPDSVQ